MSVCIFKHVACDCSSSSAGNLAIHYILPVLRITSYLRTMARTRKGLVIKVIYKDSRTGVKSDVCD